MAIKQLLYEINLNYNQVHTLPHKIIFEGYESALYMRRKQNEDTCTSTCDYLYCLIVVFNLILSQLHNDF